MFTNFEHSGEQRPGEIPECTTSSLFEKSAAASASTFSLFSSEALARDYSLITRDGNFHINGVMN